MANSSYLQLVNKVCNQINEVELTSSNFDDARAIYKAIKDGVNFAISQINAKHHVWPFNFVEGQSQLLAVGDNFYDFPADFKIADWYSFYLVKDDSLNINTTVLKKINKNQFHLYTKEQDFDHTTSGRSKPVFVFPWGNKAFGISPSPDQAYTVKYNYYKNSDQLSASSDETSIPVEFDYVIVLGAMWYLNLFRENKEGADMVKKMFEDECNSMRTILINKDEDMVDTRVNQGYSRSYINSVEVGV